MEAESLLKDASPKFRGFLEKWRLLFECRRHPNEQNRRLLTEFSQKAILINEFETARDTDRFIALIFRDARLFWRIYFGTPYPAFRKRLIADWGESLSIPRFTTIGDPKTSKRSLSLVPGVADCPEIEPSQPQRLLAILASDLYRPHRIASLFSRLFPAEYFNPTSSPGRIREAVRSTRAWLKRHGHSIGIIHNTFGYSLHIPNGTAVWIGKTDFPSRTLWRLEVASLKFGNRDFTPQDLEQLLGISARSVSRELSNAVEEKFLTRIGKGPSTRYRFLKR